MATWHQQKARPTYWHETKWTLLSDPPGECASVMRFDTEEEARKTFNAWKERGEKHLLLLAPAHHRSSK